METFYKVMITIFNDERKSTVSVDETKAAFIPDLKVQILEDRKIYTYFYETKEVADAVKEELEELNEFSKQADTDMLKEFCRLYGISDEELSFFEKIYKRRRLYRSIIVCLIITIGVLLWLL